MTKIKMKISPNDPPLVKRPILGLILSVFLLTLAVFNAQADSPNDADPALALAPAGTLTPEWKPLFDMPLSNWELWMGIPYIEVVDASGKPVHDAAGKVEMQDWKTGLPIIGKWQEHGTPLGLGNDPKHVFTMVMMDDEPMLHITGEVFGGLTTINSYSNYHFRCQFRWGQLKWPPKLSVVRDNGILFDCVGPHGVFGHVWKRCLEFQVEENNTGDLYCLGGTGADVTVIQDPLNPAKPQDGLFYDPAGKLTTLRGKVRHLKGLFEVPLGEWNTFELYSMGQTAVEVVNGHVVQVLRNTVAYPPGNKPPVSLTAGQIQLQSEGAEADYRRVEIQGITEFPADISLAAGLNSTAK